MTIRDQFIAAIEANPNSDADRLVFADWLEENNEIEFAKALRDDYPVPLRPVLEVRTVDQLLNDGDWAEVFADENSGNVSKDTDACPPGSDVDCSPPSRADVVEIIAAVNGENDGDDWLGVFKLKDGRYLLASGGCDYTGWD